MKTSMRSGSASPTCLLKILLRWASPPSCLNLHRMVQLAFEDPSSGRDIICDQAGRGAYSRNSVIIAARPPHVGIQRGPRLDSRPSRRTQRASNTCEVVNIDVQRRGVRFPQGASIRRLFLQQVRSSNNFLQTSPFFFSTGYITTWQLFYFIQPGLEAMVHQTGLPGSSTGY